ncbi:unnamed protein product [Hydatigera taeniaeformis]|uniref:Clathrin_bdg domain-containing protein n=1 Tax=Hydatigena taeniaeformis TaxID=6205 RepID=A0A0R3X8R9_HYDTA|nr:unnamed protein product [Hydatigera taeniaeformis]
MRSLGNTSSASFQSGFDSGSLGGFDAIESVIDAEIDDAPLESSLSSQSPSERLESGSIETLNPTNTQPLPIEDPIEAYDSLVSRMATDGVEWIPPKQIAKGFPDGLSLHDNPAQWQDVNGPDDVTTPTKVQEEVTLSDARQTPHPAESSELSNRTAFVQHPSTDANDVGVSENVSKLRELQFQLNQVRFSRRATDFMSVVIVASMDDHIFVG